MLYSAYELAYAAVAPARIAAGVSAKFWRSPLNPAAGSWVARSAAAAFDVFEHAMRRYPKPEWGIETTPVNGADVPVRVEEVERKDFCRLLHFVRDEKALKKARGSNEADPAVLIVAPLSGHYATLLRGTVEAMLPDHEVYITDWVDARQVPVCAGRFDLNDYIDYLIDFMRTIGPGVHAMAVCQPGPALLSAAAVMAEGDDPCRPYSMTIMGSPIDARRSPTVPNKLSEERPFEWFEQNMIYTVPAPYLGAMRRVYPGFVQLYSFLAMNSDRHMNAHYDYFQHLVEGDGDSADKHRSFYDEYLAVLDMTEEFYLQTIRDVFQEHKLAKGEFMHHGRLVRPEAITDIALMTVEGENDDISGIGQTQAAHDLCANIPDKMQLDYIQPNVGHYGVFNGSRWRNEIQPKVAKFMRMAEKEAVKRAPMKAAAE
ncbi:polyhydroxyalkanoate depolymerase [Hyphococcus flavus]|uniref:Polyhydroxyalkanoate depolymerase n=1 Tax=Hyphococcus flavus TaxID=1866326 RepID=A0AAE9ZDL3_9PROT|nr:polyhydroxyalkanoate depolymerase [Hyphococcus flavus]WDI33113.1 polyhydroxyalkanoate depolymerase [Hyphococcus flavus]